MLKIKKIPVYIFLISLALDYTLVTKKKKTLKHVTGAGAQGIKNNLQPKREKESCKWTGVILGGLNALSTFAPGSS